MTEITRVPLPPLAKGSLTKLWIGVAAALLGAAAIAETGTPPAVEIKTLTAGTGASPTADDVVIINYTGTLANGTVFDSAQHAVFPVAKVIPGFTKALEQMQRGGKYTVKIPPSLGYGNHPAGPIPADSTLFFTIELIDFRNMAELEAQQRAMEQQMRAMRGGAAPGEPPAGGTPPGGAAPATP